MNIRCALIGSGNHGDPYRADLPSYDNAVTNQTTLRVFVDVPVVDVPADVQAFVAAYPCVDLITPLPVPFPSSLAASWRDHLAQRYGVGGVRWSPVVY